MRYFQLLLKIELFKIWRHCLTCGRSLANISKIILFATAPRLRVNAYFATVIRFIFNLRDKKMIRHMFVMLEGFLWFFFLQTVLSNIAILEPLKCGCCWCELVHPVPSWQQIDVCHSLLLVKLLTGAFTVFPTGILGFAALIRALGAAGFGLGFLRYTHAKLITE